MKKRIKTGLIVTAIMLFIVSTTSAQTGYGGKNIGDDRIDTLLQLYMMQNQKFPVIDGYRIQIYKETGNAALDSAWSVKERFEFKYPKIPAYISFREPYYRVRVGDFRTRLEAIRFLERIHRRYPYAWEIKDKIRFQNKNEIQQPQKTL